MPSDLTDEQIEARLTKIRNLYLPGTDSVQVLAYAESDIAFLLHLVRQLQREKKELEDELEACVHMR